VNGNFKICTPQIFLDENDDDDKLKRPL